jgi:hypothetical protein
MACGFIPAEYVTHAMPFDGLIVHEERTDDDIRNLDGDYLYDWNARQWRFDPISKKRKRSQGDDTIQKSLEKRQRLLEGGVQVEDDISETSGDNPMDTIYCDNCGHGMIK